MAVDPTSLLSGGLTGGITDALKNITPTSSATSGPATSGPASANNSIGYAFAAPFNVGSGTASGAADSSPSNAGSSNQTLMLIALAIAGLLGLGMLAILKKK
jgi:hypothetical protein